MKGWRTYPKTPEGRKLAMMRSAKTNAERSHGMGGLPKTPGRSQKPVTLPKLPWDEGNPKEKA